MSAQKDDSELIELLTNVSDSYEDFVFGVALIARMTGTRDELVKYITEHPEAMTDDIIEFQNQFQLD